jgi:hypothetical protein
MRRPVRLPAVLLAASLVLVGCGSTDSADSTPTPSPAETETATPSESPTAAATPTPSKEPEKGTTIDITIKGGKARPDGKRIKAKAGEPVRLHIVSDVDGELHVHSSPEKEIAYKAGTTNKKITIDRPGVVDIEDHELSKLLVQLEVR